MMTQDTTIAEDDISRLFSATELAQMEAAANARRPERRWDNLFPVGQDRITLPLLREGASNSFDVRLERLLAAHNEAAAQKTITEEFGNTDPLDKKIPYARLSRNPDNRSQLNVSFRKKIRGQYTDDYVHIGVCDLGKFLHSQMAWSLERQYETEKSSRLLDETPPQDKKPPATLEIVRENTKDFYAGKFDPDSMQVVISRSPLDIISMSTGRRWYSCMSDSKFQVYKELEAGTLVAWLVAKEDTAFRYPLMRIALKPFASKTGQTILVPNITLGAHYYDPIRAMFEHTVKDYVRHLVNDKESQTFYRDESVHSGDRQLSHIAQIGKVWTPDALAQEMARFTKNKIDEYSHHIGSEQKNPPEKISLTAIKRDSGRLRALYVPEGLAKAYHYALEQNSLGGALPSVQELMGAASSQHVQSVLECCEPKAMLYLLPQHEWAEYLRAHPQVTQLNLPACHDKVETICEVMRDNHTITSLALEHNEIKSVPAMEALAQNTHLTSLNLHYNHLDSKCVAALAPSKTLKTLRLDLSNARDDGAVALAANNSLRSLSMIMSYVGDRGAMALAENRSLIALNLSSNQIGKAGMLALAGNKVLASLDISYNEMTVGDTQFYASLYASVLQSKNMVEFTMRGDELKPLADHLRQNKEIAERYISMLLSDAPLDASDKQEIAARASAIRHVASRPYKSPQELSWKGIQEDTPRLNLSPEQIRIIDAKVDEIVMEYGQVTQWARAVQRPEVGAARFL